MWLHEATSSPSTFNQWAHIWRLYILFFWQGKFCSDLVKLGEWFSVDVTSPGRPPPQSLWADETSWWRSLWGLAPPTCRRWGRRFPPRAASSGSRGRCCRLPSWKPPGLWTERRRCRRCFSAAPPCGRWFPEKEASPPFNYMDLARRQEQQLLPFEFSEWLQTQNTSVWSECAVTNTDPRQFALRFQLIKQSCINKCVPQNFTHHWNILFSFKCIWIVSPIWDE